MADQNVTLNLQSLRAQSAHNARRAAQVPDTPKPRQTTAPSFAKLLERASASTAALTSGQSTQSPQGGALKISKHAEARLLSRNISLSDAQRRKISDALEQAEQKGVRDTLVMLDGLALVANTKSRTVITAVGASELRQNIFTNIDGAVFA
ncbi:MAG: flagellar biosynthesis protein [Clostridiales bacterium]|jgi:flagellar operon protein|nr:flagellar biosynthesis protein [Clostridiales bacterium]